MRTGRIRRTATGALAVSLTAPAVVLLASIGPAAAEEPGGSLADAAASAVTVSVGGTPHDSGRYAVSNDGTRQSSTGTDSPALSLLGGQSALSIGTLAQAPPRR